MPQNHRLDALPENIHWGFHDASLPPVLRIRSGDTVELTSWAAADREDLPPDPSLVQPGHREAIEKCVRGGASHMLTGPVFVEGAAPGDVLQIDILDVRPIDRWGYVCIVPLRGTLPGDFDTGAIIHPEIDIQQRTARLPWGKEIALAPFFGVMGVAPPAHWGRLPSVQPRKFGGNMDNKELQAGTTLYLPVFVEGGLFSAGDGHGVQGDGEVCISALETGLTGSFRLTVRKDLGYAYPFAESATHLISIGLHEDLDEAARIAVREMIGHICRRTSLTREEAYMLCSLQGDLRVTQTVDGEKGCHMMLPKNALT
ncbi:acetamidase/formamidase family protein [Acuticoccus kandeliae]|uniref:acetamidase/formamidase family protein n=1 Tax=Acuticoccus kandeliae TaxID=2073160 RepID=UPI000D3E6CEC|nr:acetamidase/formamidase family protein [Acuticoccus kandeliae]